MARTRSPVPLKAFLPILVALLAAGASGCDGSSSAIPDRTVVLTFDDAVRNHLTTVVPLLEQHGFGATFFVTERGMGYEDVFLTWPEVAEIHRLGFEVGNHTSGHLELCRPDCVEALASDTARMEACCESGGIPRPTSFAWPGSTFGPEARTFLAGRGYRFARRGMKPEGSPLGEDLGPVYDPRRNDPLLVPSCVVTARWDAARFRQTAEQARDGRTVAFMFHGIPDSLNVDLSVDPATFRAFLQVLADGGYHVVALRDLARWVDPARSVPDPMLGRRWPE